MAQDDDRFEPRLGRSRKDRVRQPKTLRTQLLPRIARAGGNPHRLRSAVAQQAKPPRSGRFNARGRGAKIAATFPRGSGWSFDRASGMNVRPPGDGQGADREDGREGRRGPCPSALPGREGVTREGEPGRLYSTFTDDVDRDVFAERGMDDRHQFRIILSPEDGAAYEDLKPFTRDVMAKMESDLGTTLDWVAVDHHDTGHPHVHVVVRGITEDGKTLTSLATISATAFATGRARC